MQFLFWFRATSLIKKTWQTIILTTFSLNYEPWLLLLFYLFLSLLAVWTTN